MANSFKPEQPSSLDNTVLEWNLIKDLFLDEDDSLSIKKVKYYSNGRYEIQLTEHIIVHILLPEGFEVIDDDASFVPISLYINKRWFCLVYGNVCLKQFEIDVLRPIDMRFYIEGEQTRETNVFLIAEFNYNETQSFTVQADIWYGIYCDPEEPIILLEYRHKNPNTAVLSQIVQSELLYDTLTKKECKEFKKHLKEQLLILTSLTRLKNNNYGN